MIKKFENFKEKGIDYEELEDYIFNCFIELSDSGEMFFRPKMHYSGNNDIIKMGLRIKTNKSYTETDEETFKKIIENQFSSYEIIFESIDKLKLKYPDVIITYNIVNGTVDFTGIEMCFKF
jgi:DNA polymerase elongation subunit (family B)